MMWAEMPRFPSSFVFQVKSRCYDQKQAQSPVSLTVLIWKENLASKCEKTIPKILKRSLKFEKMFKLANNIKNANLIHTKIPLPGNLDRN